MYPRIYMYICIHRYIHMYCRNGVYIYRTKMFCLISELSQYLSLYFTYNSQYRYCAVQYCKSFTDHLQLFYASIPGPKGEKGSLGPIGGFGDKGAPGVQGPKGDTGDKGESGDTGKKFLRKCCMNILCFKRQSRETFKISFFHQTVPLMSLETDFNFFARYSKRENWFCIVVYNAETFFLPY